MKKRKRFRNILLISFAVVFIAAAGIGEAWAYFTTYARAEGGYTIHLGHETLLDEAFKDWRKTVTISNEGEQPVFVRAMAFCGSDYTLLYSWDEEYWRKGDDGYYYYNEILYAGESAKPLYVDIVGVPDNPEDGLEFNVIVIYESTPVLYDEDGKPYADWNLKLDEGRWEEGGNKE